MLLGTSPKSTYGIWPPIRFGQVNFNTCVFFRSRLTNRIGDDNFFPPAIGIRSGAKPSFYKPAICASAVAGTCHQSRDTMEMNRTKEISTGSRRTVAVTCTACQPVGESHKIHVERENEDEVGVNYADQATCRDYERHTTYMATYK